MHVGNNSASSAGFHASNADGAFLNAKAETERFLLALDEEADSFTFQTFDDDKARRAERAERNKGKKKTDLDYEHDLLAHTMHGTLDQFWSRLSDLNERGAGTFITVNEVEADRPRKAENIRRVRAVFADFDKPESAPETWPLEPTMLVASSPGRLHAYWTVDNLPAEDFTETQRAIAAQLGSDPAVCDLPRVMRLPGFDHCKDPDHRHPVTVAHIEERLPYKVDDIKTAFPPVVTARRTKHAQCTDPEIATSKQIDDLGSALASMSSDDRELWVRMGHALKRLGDAGLNLWLEWSAKSEKFDEADALERWQGFATDHTGFAAVFAEAQRRGWINPESTTEDDSAQSSTAAPDDETTVRAAIDKIKADGKPGLASSRETVEALARLASGDPVLYADLRYELKRAHPGVRITTIDQLQRQAAQSLGLAEGGGDTSLADQIMALVTEGSDLFIDQEGEPHLTTRAAPRKTFHVKMKAAREWMSYLAYSELGKVASDAVLSTVITGLAGVARHGADGAGIEHHVYLRAAPAPDGNGYFIDLCNDQWSAIHVSQSGWRIVDEPPVRFRRSHVMQPLPTPPTEGDVSLLWRVANVAPQDRFMVLAWMLEAWRPDTPYPILELIGGQGSGKSDVQDRLRRLIDPNSTNLRAAPKDVESIHVGTRSNHLISYNNLSRLTALQQDALCTLATGGGYAQRTLYTNADETVIESMRPVVLNGINPLATAQDMIDRCIRVELPTIKGRRKASDLESEFEAGCPAIIGGLLDLFSRVLSILPGIEIDTPPRMADFAELGQAVYQAVGHVGDFTGDYLERQKAAVASGIEASPAAAAVLDLAEKHQNGYAGTIKGLLDALTQEFKRDGDGWPKSTRGLSDILRRQAPALLMLGVSVEFDPVRRMDGYHVRVKKVSFSQGVKKGEDVHNVHDVHETPAEHERHEPHERRSPSKHPNEKKSYSADDVHGRDSDYTEMKI